MLKVEERVIKDKVFRVQQFGAKEGRHVLVKLLKMLAPPASAFISTLDEKSLHSTSIKDIEIPFKAFAAMLAQIPYVLNEAELDELILKLGEITSFQMPNGNFIQLKGDSNLLVAFGGEDGFDYDMQNRWILFALEVNYKSFLKGLGGKETLAHIVNQAQQSESLNTSIGTSTASRSVSGINQV